jgi:uncharacterized protein RhaS with RHS repeats
VSGNSHGKLLTITDPRNNATTLTYDTNVNLTKLQMHLPPTAVAYNRRGRVTSLANALNQIKGYEYDLHFSLIDR